MTKSIKDDLLKEIEEKAQKIRDKRKKAATNKTVESLVFEFFEQIDEAKKIGEASGNWISASIVDEAIKNLKSRVNTMFDHGAKIDVVWENPEGDTAKVAGVKIYWSTIYAKTNSLDPFTYIDVNQMLLL